MSGILETLKFLGSSWLEVAVAVDKRLETQAARIAELEAENAALRNNKTQEEALREMMCDPRYWRQRDPELVNKVRDGFRKLVGGKS